MVYTVRQLSQLAGVSVRTLHYYDEIGLLKPSFVRQNGYRIYEEKEVRKLQQILLFRELEFPLDQIQRMMTAKNFDVKQALNDQYRLLTLKKAKIQRLMQVVEGRLKGGDTMTNQNQFGVFTDKQLDNFKEEARKRWGETDAYKQSVERTKHWTKSDYNRIAEEGTKFTEALSKLMDRGVADEKVQQMIEKHYQGIKVFYDCPIEMYRNIGAMYVEDPRFSAYYEKFRTGMAGFMKDAISYYCDSHTT